MQSAEKLSITLPPEMVTAIKSEVERGRYASTSEVLREAMRLWMRQEELHGERLNAIRAKLKRSLDDERPNVPAKTAFARLEAMFNDESRS